MNDRIVWIHSTDELARCMGEVREGPLALDTEADSMHRYPERVCLIQLSFGGQDYLVEPLDGLDPAPLGEVLRDRSVRKILHGADYDLRGLSRDFGLEIHGLFDTMVAARLVGERAFGLAALLRNFFDVQLEKKYQRADWSKRPLTPEMETYAANDTRHLGALAAALQERLEGLGRMSWAEEEFRRLELVRWAENADPDAFRRVKGSAVMGPPKLAIVKALHELREKVARHRARPPFKIMGDACILALADLAPRSSNELRGVPGLPYWWSEPARRKQILEAVESALATAPEDLPEVKRGRAPRRSPGFEAKVRSLCRERDGVAERSGLEPAMVAPRACLEAVVDRIDRGEDPAGHPALRTWQYSLLRPSIEAMVQSRLSEGPGVP